ncbi:hypothetical protein ABE137_11245 [Brevibacillus laterosporus]
MTKTRKEDVFFTPRDVELLKKILINNEQITKVYKEELKAILSF